MVPRPRHSQCQEPARTGTAAPLCCEFQLLRFSLDVVSWHIACEVFPFFSCHCTTAHTKHCSIHTPFPDSHDSLSAHFLGIFTQSRLSMVAPTVVFIGLLAVWVARVYSTPATIDASL